MIGSAGLINSKIPLLETKLYLPEWSADWVSRPRLIDRIHTQRKLTLVSAPAGFGKTTLLAEWIAALSTRSVAWVSLDPSDNDPAIFWSYLITALQNIHSGLGERSLSLLRSPQPPPIESVLITLLNELTAVENTVVILDDYHVIVTQAIHNGIGFLISHLPPQAHLIIASRTDPPLSLARLRSHGDLSELRASDLRFTPDEAAAFLNQRMRLSILPDEVTALEQRTEGWIAGLQLAALSLQGRKDVADFVAAFSGDDRYIVDYLMEEVLQRQPEHVRRFLLQTAILERLNGSLCDALTSQTDGQGMLERLERGNLFIIPLDNKRQWYRYHHLFADVLQAYAQMEWPERMASLHAQASEWYEQNDLFADAIRHALTAQDFERAASLIEQVWPTMRQRQRQTTVLGWITSLPDSLIRHRPVLSVAYALVLLNDGQLEAVESRLQDAERCLEAAANSRESLAVESIVTENAQLRSLPASIANARAYRATALKDASSTVTYAQQALELLPEDEEYERGTTAALLGLAFWTSGRPEAGYHSFAEGLAIFKQMGLPQMAIGGTLILAQMSIAQGRLHQVINICEQSLQLATEQDGPVRAGTPELYLGLSEVRYEQGDLAAASQLLLSGETLRQQASLSGVKYLWWVVQARLTAAKGDLETALDQLHEAERIYSQTPMPVPDVRPIPALRARLWLRQGRLTEALSWVRECGLSMDDKPDYLREYEHLTLARVAIAQYERDSGGCNETGEGMHRVIGLLTRLLAAAEAEERTGSSIKILVVLALAQKAQSDVSAAITALERALTLAEPEGYVRIFAESGTPMRQLLQETMTRGITVTYSQRLLTTLETWGQKPKEPSPLPLSPSPPPLIEPLSQRELDVLRLLNTELSGPEIASELVVALSTVRTHTKRIYSKLNVTNRRAAVKRAVELELI
ncbi:transcriptional regulator, LuxR family protein [Synechococcus sp. PCC 7335]|uniref:LuxR C-terminal-related transcriptional regulator n=1 Tax=Synechococcus sp. (strain ATCC 29403 / PCC 7335) TaxID=91464 RepID=UPI00017EDD86|nr:LuxR C-terminal-related transcriptional regulator [Synechococcus sp. PCC 7335]EDX82662.1 transcriptional regulator, LuxR family protein [Synechococcus sp. PCC 7335]